MVVSREHGNCLSRRERVLQMQRERVTPNLKTLFCLPAVGSQLKWLALGFSVFLIFITVPCVLST